MLRRLVPALCAAFALLVAPATAHVRIVGDTTVTGGADLHLILRCPTERNSNTISLTVQLPAGIDPATVRLPPVAGWRSSRNGDTVTWEGGTIPPGAAGYFALDVSLPHGPRDLPFKSVQTYADGTVVRWIELADPDEPNPPHPAPVLHVR